MQIQVWFTNNKYIDVRLFNNKTIAKWFDHFGKLNLLDYYKSVVINHTCQDPLTNNDSEWNIILNTVEILKSIGYNFPYQLPDKFNYNQSTLNLLHRFFTYNAMWYHDNEADSSICNPFDSKFKLPNEMSYVEWLGIIDRINNSVHKIENSVTLSDNKKLIVNKFPITSVYSSPKNKLPTNLSPWLIFTEEDQQYNYTYNDSELPLVVLDNAILGKCVLQSFYDDDDLNAKDCTGRLGSYGGFFIDLNDNRKKIYRSQQFKTWVEKHNRSIDSLPLEFPIGYVINYTDVISWCSWDLIFKKLVFVDNDNK